MREITKECCLVATEEFGYIVGVDVADIINDLFLPSFSSAMHDFVRMLFLNFDSLFGRLEVPITI